MTEPLPVLSRGRSLAAYIKRYKGINSKTFKHQVRANLTNDQVKSLVKLNTSKELTEGNAKSQKIFKASKHISKKGFKSSDDQRLLIKVDNGRIVIPTKTLSHLKLVYDGEANVMQRLNLKETELFPANVMLMLEAKIRSRVSPQHSPRQPVTSRLSPTRTRYCQPEATLASRRLLAKYDRLFEDEPFRANSVQPRRLGERLRKISPQNQLIAFVTP